MFLVPHTLCLLTWRFAGQRGIEMTLNQHTRHITQNTRANKQILIRLGAQDEQLGKILFALTLKHPSKDAGKSSYRSHSVCVWWWCVWGGWAPLRCWRRWAVVPSRVYCVVVWHVVSKPAAFAALHGMC